MLIPRNPSAPLLLQPSFDPRVQTPRDIIRNARSQPIDLALMHFVTNDHDMLAMKAHVRKLAFEPDPILIQGPSGVGKEIIASVLSKGAVDSKLFTINCGALPASIIHSILFGHKRGSFTGATEDYPGVLVEAHHSCATVFLDEIGKLPLDLQGLLLRAIQYKVVTPVGSTKEVSINNCRFISAAKEDLLALVDAGKFLEDLYGRIYTHIVNITPLFARPGDIDLIAHSLGHNEPIPDSQYNTGVNIFRFNVRAIIAYIKRHELA